VKLLLTGGCGFIGSNFIRYMLSAYPDCKICNLDKLTYAGNRENLKDVEKDRRYKFVRGDICDLGLVMKLSKDCDAIINFAAETHVDRSIKDPTNFVRTNVFGTYVLLEAVRANRIKRFVQISTDETYGSILKGKFTESDALRPNSPYAASKASADLICRSYHITFKTPVIITRSSNNFGPYQFPEKIIPLFISNIIENKKVPVYADGANMRDWLYVEDNCRAIDRVLHKGAIGEIYNIGSGKELKNIDLTCLILGIMGKTRSLMKFVKDRPGHDKRYALNCAKIHRIGWYPREDFRKGLVKTVEWYLENEDWWMKLKKRNKD